MQAAISLLQQLGLKQSLLVTAAIAAVSCALVLALVLGCGAIYASAEASMALWSLLHTPGNIQAQAQKQKSILDDSCKNCSDQTSEDQMENHQTPLTPHFGSWNSRAEVRPITTYSQIGQFTKTGVRGDGMKSSIQKT
ncbi:MAG: hypothetical protein WAW96_13510 [Alphaproteobacteria bacterium]